MNNHPSDSPTQRDDVDVSTPDGFPDALLAERYAGGDMSAEIADAFEAALDSPELLEQLVTAVQTRDAVSGASSGVTRPSYRRRTRPSKLSAGLITAAALTVTFACLLWPSIQNGTTAIVDNPENRHLAPVWVELPEQAESFQSIDAQLAEFDQFETNSFESLIANRVNEEANAADVIDQVTNVPDWMYAAIALPSDESESLEGTL